MGKKNKSPVECVDFDITCMQGEEQGFLGSQLSIRDIKHIGRGKSRPNPKCDHDRLKANLEKIGVFQYGGGLPIAYIEANGAAERAGLMKWDTIVKIGETDVRLKVSSEIHSMIKAARQQSGGRFNITVIRSSIELDEPTDWPMDEEISSGGGMFSCIGGGSKPSSRRSSIADKMSPAEARAARRASITGSNAPASMSSAPQMRGSIGFQTEVPGQRRSSVASVGSVGDRRGSVTSDAGSRRGSTVEASGPNMGRRASMGRRDSVMSVGQMMPLPPTMPMAPQGSMMTY